jgi:hypothetical protein
VNAERCTCCVVSAFSQLKKMFKPGAGRLTPVILATQEAEISRIMVRSQPHDK